MKGARETEKLRDERKGREKNEEIKE